MVALGHFATVAVEQLMLNEDDEKLIEDSVYVFTGNVTKNGAPYSGLKINNTQSDVNGDYRLEMTNRKLLQQLTSSAGNLDSLEVNDPDLYKKLLDMYGDQTAPGLVFKVQIAAYNNPQNYTSSHLSGLGDIETAVLDDGITRFTIGHYATLREADTLKRKAIEKGQDDAFVIMFINGKRTYLDELIDSGLFK